MKLLFVSNSDNYSAQLYCVYRLSIILGILISYSFADQILKTVGKLALGRYIGDRYNSIVRIMKFYLRSGLR